jgi:methyl-accepting chemotaxis protein
MLKSAHPSNSPMGPSGMGLARIRAALVRVRSFAAHHGIWAPGIRLLRNLGLREKAMLLAGCIGLPLALMLAHALAAEWGQYSQAQRRQAGLRHVHGLEGLERSVSAVKSEALRAEAGGGWAGLRTALAGDQVLFDAFVLAVDQGPLAAGLRQPMDSLRERRKAMLLHAGNGSARALPGLAALPDYSLELAVLRAEIARDGGIAADVPAHVRALYNVATLSVPRLRWLVGRMQEVGSPLYEHADRAERARRLVRLAAQAQVVLENAESDLAYALARGLPGSLPGGEPLAAVRQQVDLAFTVAAAAAKLPSGTTGEAAAGLAAASGVTRAAYIESGRRAIEASRAADAAAVASLQAWGGQQVQSIVRRLQRTGALLAAWLLLSAYLLTCTYRVLAGGLDTLCEHLERIGRGDLSRRPKGFGRDEIGRALNALSTSSGHMSQLLGAVTQGVAAVSQAAREVASGNAGLSGRTAEVRGLISSVAGSAEACSGALDRCGDQVEQTAELIHGMHADGQRSGKAMAGLRESMARLQVKSREIGQVVTLVEAIAYQTKLLSINASMEAARAGPAGRGFAVVAHEVRALAQRSEQAAQRIGGIVSASIDEIDAGGIMAGRANDAVLANQERIEGVAALIREAVALTRTGRTESQEVRVIARGVEESMASNMRVVEQLTHASASLRTQGDELKRSVQHFVFG